MENMTVFFDKDDTIMYDLLKAQFGKNLQFDEIKPFDAMNAMTAVVIPAIALSIQSIDFFLSHFKNDEKPDRKIEVKGGKISLTNYSADDAVKILESILQ